jgi:hypothetical protein
VLKSAEYPIINTLKWHLLLQQNAPWNPHSYHIKLLGYIAWHNHIALLGLRNTARTVVHHFQLLSWSYLWFYSLQRRSPTKIVFPFSSSMSAIANTLHKQCTATATKLS